MKVTCSSCRTETNYSASSVNTEGVVHIICVGCGGKVMVNSPIDYQVVAALVKSRYYTLTNTEPEAVAKVLREEVMRLRRELYSIRSKVEDDYNIRHNWFQRILQRQRWIPT